MSQEINSHMWYSVKEASAFLNVKETTVRVYLKEGKLNGKKKATKGLRLQWVISGEEIQHFLDSFKN